MATAKKKPTTKKSTARSPRAKVTKRTVEYKSRRKPSPFMSFSPTIETAYWAILGALVIILAIWVWHLTAQIDDIYNQIDANTASYMTDTPPSQTMHPMKHK